MLRSNASPRSYRGGGTLAALLDANLRIMTLTQARGVPLASFGFSLRRHSVPSALTEGVAVTQRGRTRTEPGSRKSPLCLPKPYGDDARVGV